MRLNIALRISDGEIVAFVGGGGKTTAMFRLAGEIVEAGGRVITTTTTRIFAAQISLAPTHLYTFEARRADVEAALNEHNHVLITGPVNGEEGKAAGVTPGLVEDLRAIPGLSAILIEADGSRMRPFKAPAEHEPVIPGVTSLVVPVVGADVFGGPLTEARVHRVELVRALTGAAEGEPVTPELVAQVIGHPLGGLKRVPSGARVIPLINKVETPESLALARATAARMLENPNLTSVVIGAVKWGSHPVREVHGRVAAIVLAAGRSMRMGRSKQTLPWGDTTMLGEVVRRLQASGLSEIVVVTGAERESVEAALAEGFRSEAQREAAPVRFAFNPDFETSEMARSLQVGLRSLPGNCMGALVALADQPQMEAETVRVVIQRWRETLAPVAAPIYQGQRGHPLLFDRSTWADLFKLPAEANPREFLRAAGRVELVEVDTDSILRDIDTPDDYAREQRPRPEGF